MKTVLHYIPSLVRAGAETLLVNNIRCRDALKFRHVVCYGDPPEDLLSDLNQAGVEVIRVGNGGGVRSFRPELELYRIIRTVNPDLVHLDMFPSRYGALATWLARKPLVVTLPSVFGGRRISASSSASTCTALKSRALIRIEAFMLRRIARRFIAVAHDVKKDAVQSLGISDLKIDVVYPGLSVDRFRNVPASDIERVRSELGVGDASPLLLSVGRLNPGKGFEDLVEMVVHLRSEYPSACLLIAGEGPSRQDLESRIKDSGLEHNVRLLGVRTDVPALLKLCDLFVFASHYEGLSYAVMEAGAAGRPVIAFDAPGVRESVDDGQSGFLIKQRSPAEFAEKVGALIKSPQLVQRLSESGAAMAKDRFDRRASVARLEEIYSEIIATAVRASGTQSRPRSSGV